MIYLKYTKSVVIIGMKRDLPEEEIEFLILDYMDRHGYYGGKSGGNYKQKNKLEKTVSNKIRRNGKKIKRIVENLRKRDILKVKKEGRVLYIPIEHKTEVIEHLRNKEW